MQKSKKMMVSLCGLALSSLFVLNNKSVVHADTTTDSNNQNSAISWNEDSDQAQGVQNTQKADDDQQNAQSVQPSRAETSNVESSSVQRSSTNQTAAVQSPKISNINDAQAAVPVVINNPANNKVHVHYVDSNGNAIDNSGHDYDIDATKTGQGSYTVPNGYSLNNPDGKYNVNGGTFGADALKGNVEHHDARTRLDHIKVGTSTGTKHDVTVYNNGQRVTNDIAKGYLPTDIRNLPDLAVTGVHEKSGVDPRNRDAQKVDIDYKYTKYEDKTTVLSPAYTTQTLPVAFVDSNNNLVGMIQNYSGKVGTTQNVSLTVPTGYKLADGASLPTSVTFANSETPKLIKIVSDNSISRVPADSSKLVHVKFVDQETGQDVGGSYDINFGKEITHGTSTVYHLDTDNPGPYEYKVPAGYAAVNNKYDVMFDSTMSIADPNSTTHNYKLTDFMSDDDALKVQQAYRNSYMMRVHTFGGNSDDVGAAVYLSPNTYNDTMTKNEPSWVSEYSQYKTEYGFTPGLADEPQDDIVMRVKVTGGVTRSGQIAWFSLPIKNVSQSTLKTAYQKYMSATGNSKQSMLCMCYIDETGLTDTGNIVNGNTVTVPVHKTNSFSFADNSGNVKSVSGNTVDVTLTKPQSVNPAMDTRCQSQATRTIQINFPDGQIPQSYDGIVDKSGKLVQTVHFTRTATEDALTGNILQYGNWTSDNKDHNFIGFPERTLPRIPGYTLKITPASVHA